jgi:parallel beta-helix repeat protein
MRSRVRKVLLLSLVASLLVLVAAACDYNLGGSVATTTTVKATTTTTVRPTTTTTTTAPATTCSGVTVKPGANVQNVLNAYGQGTTFCFQPGTYVLTGFVVPKSYDRLISVVPRGAIFTGKDVYNAGVHGYGGSAGQHDVLFQGFVVSHMLNSMTTNPNSALAAGYNWRMENNEVAYNAQIGVVVNNGAVLNGNFIHHNGRYGFGGGPATNILISNNEVSWNNTAHNAISNAGGSKITKSSYVTFRNNSVHDNYGHGLHTDTENIHITYEYNTVDNNYGGGIFHENSADAVIRYNKLSGNDMRIKGQSLFWGADLYLNDSKNTEIYGNTIKAGVHAIGLYDVDRGSGAYGLYEIRNDYVHDNTVILPAGGVSGLVGSRSTAYASTTANRFVHNSYLVTNTAASSWVWSSLKTWSQWRSVGNDTTGTLSLST